MGVFRLVSVRLVYGNIGICYGGFGCRFKSGWKGRVIFDLRGRVVKFSVDRSFLVVFFRVWEVVLWFSGCRC